MVLKLIKHEIEYLGRYLSLIWLGILLVIISNRLLTEFHSSDNDILKMVASSGVTLLILSVIAMFLITFFTIIIRFYTSMFSGEGYLTFTLPVKTGAIIFSKLFSGFLFMLVPMITTGLLVISYIRDSEVWYILYSGLLGFLDQTDISMVTLIVFLITAILGMIAQLLEFYLAMSFGQLANRNKIIFSIIAYIAIYTIKQMLGFIFWAVYASGGFFVKTASEFVNSAIWMGFFGVIFYIIISWFLVHYLCKNKLNLE